MSDWERDDYNDGYQAGMERAQAEAEATLQQIRQLVEKWHKQDGKRRPEHRRCASCGCRRWEHEHASVKAGHHCICESCSGWKLIQTKADELAALLPAPTTGETR